ncbi:MAG: hypothetical protein ACOXZ4_03265 [Sphaerochaetaceae bacterium]
MPPTLSAFQRLNHLHLSTSGDERELAMRLYEAYGITEIPTQAPLKQSSFSIEHANTLLMAEEQRYLLLLGDVLVYLDADKSRYLAADFVAFDTKNQQLSAYKDVQLVDHGEQREDVLQGQLLSLFLEDNTVELIDAKTEVNLTTADDQQIVIYSSSSALQATENPQGNQLP